MPTLKVEQGKASDLRRRLGVASSRYASSLNRRVKVLDFVQDGGPKLTVGSAMFELDFGLNAEGSRAL